AQDTTTTTKKDTVAPAPGDTIRVGNLIIIKKGKIEKEDHTTIHMYHRHNTYRPSNISTNWGILDLGFANYNDQTNYSSVSAQQFAPGSTKDWFRLRTGKSVNVNIWI